AVRICARSQGQDRHRSVPCGGEGDSYTSYLFFRAEDGIRDRNVTGVQTCALPIFFWLRYLPRQDFRGTLLHVFLMTLSVATATCVPFVVSRVLRPGDIRIPKSKNVVRMILGTTRAALATGCILFIISLGVNRGLPADRA